jgi:hypothetical protein
MVAVETPAAQTQAVAGHRPTKLLRYPAALLLLARGANAIEPAVNPLQMTKQSHLRTLPSHDLAQAD